jgi:hypothetical protein
MKQLTKRTKKIALRIIIVLILLLITFFLCAQTSAYNKIIYRDYGTFKLVSGNNVISISAFATIEEIDSAIYVNDIQNNTLQVQKMQKNVIIEPKTLYHYELYLISKSIFERDTTSTWLYGTRIFVDGEDVLANQSPNGFVVSIKTTPTSIYTYYSGRPDVKFEIKWEKAIYEPRIRK